jgi:hypothetical protein
MIDIRVVLIAATIAGVVWIGGETIQGVRWVKHHVQHAVHVLVHPHQAETKP